MATENLSTEHDRDHVGSLAKGLDVLELLATEPVGLTLSETAERLGMTRAGARRFLLTLVTTGYVTQDGRRFALSPRLISVARAWLDRSSLWTQALGPMRKVAGALNESCSAAVLADEDVVYVARVPGETIIMAALHVGTRLPAYCTSMGRVLLSGLPPAKLDDFLARATISRRTERTIVDRALLAGRIAAAGRVGYALVDEELEIGLRSIAVPVRDRQGRIVAAINVSTQAARFTPPQMVERMLPRLREASSQIEAFLSID